MAKKWITKAAIGLSSKFEREGLKKKKVRIGARIDEDLHMICKMAYNRQGISMESRIEELLRRDADVMSKNQWFKEMMQSDLFAKYVQQANSGNVSQEISSEEEDDQFSGKYDIGGDDENT